MMACEVLATCVSVLEFVVVSVVVVGAVLLSPNIVVVVVFVMMVVVVVDSFAATVVLSSVAPVAFSPSSALAFFRCSSSACRRALTCRRTRDGRMTSSASFIQRI